MPKSLTISTIKYIATEIILDILRLPLWWYSSGLINAASRLKRQVKFGLQLTGLKIWLINLFKPMFGQTSFQGRLISFAMRFIFLIFRSLAMLLWLLISLVIFLVWLALPPFVIYMIIRQLV